MTVLHGDVRDILPTLPDNSLDSIVTDPPYELAFMGKRWDSSGVAFDTAVWAECLRILKPGGHLLAFGGTRTWHRLACAVEDAGFEIRDSIAWLYGSGFPKSMDVSKAIDKAAGAEREVVGERFTAKGNGGTGNDFLTANSRANVVNVTAPATPEAAQWEGWGTALKPGFEPIAVARKPLKSTVAATVIAHGTGALNIDGCRIGTGGQLQWAQPRDMGYRGSNDSGQEEALASDRGRWPANVVLDDAAAEELEQSRFFYVAKAPKSERPKVDGVAHTTVKPLALMQWLIRLVTPPRGTVLDPFAGSGSTVEAAILEGFEWIAIEREESYLPLIQHRIDRQTSVRGAVPARIEAALLPLLNRPPLKEDNDD